MSTNKGIYNGTISKVEQLYLIVGGIGLHTCLGVGINAGAVVGLGLQVGQRKQLCMWAAILCVDQKIHKLSFHTMCLSALTAGHYRHAQLHLQSSVGNLSKH